MNILIFSWRGPGHPLAGGAEQVTHEHAKAWVKAGHKVTLFTSSFEGGMECEEVDGVKIIRRGSQFLGVQLAALYWYLFQKYEKFDLVVDHFHGIPFFTPFFVRKPKLAVLQEVAGEVWKLNHLPWPFNWIVGNIGYYLEPLVFLFYKKVPFMVGSKSAKDDLSKMGIPKSNIKIVHHGVKLDLPKVLPRKEKEKTAIYLGAVAKDKGVEDAIKAFCEISENEDNWQFWIVGKGEKNYVRKLKNDCIKFDIERKTKFWGFVSDKKKFELLTKAHVFINPSVREGWGLVNIEANAVGTPVVAYNVAGIKDSVRDLVTGVLCKEKYPKCLAKEAVGLLNDPKKYAIVSSGAVKWSKKFNWEKATKESLELIDSFMK